MRVLWLTAFVLVGCWPSSVTASTQVVDGEVVVGESNPLVKQPIAVARFHVRAIENRLTDAVQLDLEIAPATITTRSGDVEVPEWLAAFYEARVELMSPAGERIPVTRPVQYEIGIRRQSPLFQVSLLRTAGTPTSVLTNPPPLIVPSTTEPPLNLLRSVHLAGLNVDSNGYPTLNENGGTEFIKHRCQTVTERDLPDDQEYPICSDADVNAFKGLYAGPVEFTSRILSVQVPLGRLQNTAGTWFVVVADTRPVIHDEISLSMLPLDAGGGSILTQEPPEIKALFPRFAITDSKLTIGGDLNPLPDRSPRTWVFNNELRADATELIDALGGNPSFPNPNAPSILSIPSVSGGGTSISGVAGLVRDRRAMRGANTLVASGLTLDELEVRVAAIHVGNDPRPDAVAATLISPDGSTLSLTGSLVDREMRFRFTRDERPLPASLRGRKIDGKWILKLTSENGELVHQDFALDWSLVVTGRLTDRFSILELETPQSMRDGDSKTFSFGVDGSGDVRDLWIRPFADNFLAFRHELTATSPSGRSYGPCARTNEPIRDSCLDVGPDGLAARIHAPVGEQMEGTWLVSWTVKKDETVLEEASGGQLTSGTCDSSDLRAYNDPVLSAIGTRTDNPFGFSSPVPQSHIAELLAADTVSISGLSFGLSTTRLTPELHDHGILDRLERTLSRVTYNRATLAREFRAMNRLLGDSSRFESPQHWVSFFDSLAAIYGNRSLEGHMALKGALAARAFDVRFLSDMRQQRIDSLLAARAVGLSGWRNDLDPEAAQGMLTGWGELGRAEQRQMIWAGSLWNDTNLAHYMFGGEEVQDAALNFAKEYITGVGSSVLLGVATFAGCEIFLAKGVDKGIGCGLVGGAAGAYQFSKKTPDIIWAGSELAVAVLKEVIAEDEPDGPGEVEIWNWGEEDEILICSNDLNETCDVYKEDEDGDFDWTGESISREDVGFVVVEVDDETWYCPPESPKECRVYSEDEDGNLVWTGEIEDGSEHLSGEGGDGEGEEATECDEENEDCDNTNNSESAGCRENPDIPCNDPPPSWLQQYISSHPGGDPIVLQWGALTPYINCGPDGCDRAVVIPTDPQYGGSLDPYINCDADGVTCQQQDAIGKICTAFNWADTFTDPVPIPNDPADDPDGPDCTDATHPCTEEPSDG